MSLSMNNTTWFYCVCLLFCWMAGEAVCGQLWFLLKTICMARSCSQSFICRLLKERAWCRVAVSECGIKSRSCSAAAKGERISIVHFFSFFLFPTQTVHLSFMVWNVLLMESLCRWWLQMISPFGSRCFTRVCAVALSEINFAPDSHK